MLPGINEPYHCCPHCEEALLSPLELQALSSRLEDELAATIAKEDKEKQRLAEQTRREAGAFPGLPGQRTSAPGTPRTHKGMSLTSNRKVVASFSSTPSSSQPPMILSLWSWRE